MKNEAVAAIFEHLCGDARNFLHVTFGAIDIAGGNADPAQRATLSMGRASADRLLRCIDDIHELVANTPVPAATVEEIDAAAIVREIVYALNLTSGKRRRHMDLDAPDQPIRITQCRRALEQVLTRILDTVFKLSQISDVHVKVGRGENGVRLTMHTRDGDLAPRLVHWLNSSLDDATLQGPDDVSFGIAVMVAGKHLRALGGAAAQASDAAGHASVVVTFGSVPEDHTDTFDSTREIPADALNILVAEDCEDSFALCEAILEDERVHRARDGHEAIRLVQKQRFDIVLMDVHMPGMDGYSAIRGIRDWETQTGNARTPLVILSSDDLETQQRSAAQAGCSGFLRKPLRPGDLTDLLKRLKRSRELVA